MENKLIEYGKKMEKLGELFQDPHAKLSDLVQGCLDIDLIFHVGLEPSEPVDLKIGPDQEWGSVTGAPGIHFDEMLANQRVKNAR